MDGGPRASLARWAGLRSDCPHVLAAAETTGAADAAYLAGAGLTTGHHRMVTAWVDSTAEFGAPAHRPTLPPGFAGAHGRTLALEGFEALEPLDGLASEDDDAEPLGTSVA